MAGDAHAEVSSARMHVDGYAEGDDERLRIIQEDMENKDGRMKLLKVQDGVEIFSGHMKDSNLVLIMGKGTIEAPVGEVNELFADFERLMQVSDAMYIHNSGFDKPIDSEHSLSYGRYRMPKLIANRDFLWLSHGPITRDGNIHFCIARSTEHPHYPPVPGFVRGSLLRYVWKPNQENPEHTDMCMLLQVDPKGWIPTFVVNMTASDSAMNLARINKYLKAQRAKK